MNTDMNHQWKECCNRLTLTNALKQHEGSALNALTKVGTGGNAAVYRAEFSDGAVDPFHLLYAEPEYELFALSVGFERRFPFLAEYEKHRPLSEKFPLKLEFYAIFSEDYWYRILKTNIPSFFRYKARLLKRQLDKFGMK